MVAPTHLEIGWGLIALQQPALSGWGGTISLQ